MDSRGRLAWNIRRLRTGLRMSQDALAYDAGVDRTYVGGIERQEFNPSLDVLDRLAKSLRVDVSELLELPESKTPPAPLRRGRKPGSPAEE